MIVTLTSFEDYKLITGHVLEAIKAVPDNSVHCVVTSPPYLWLRNYNTDGSAWGGDAACNHVWDLSDDTMCACGAWKGELGQEPTVDLYATHLAQVLSEVKRVLRDDGICWLNIGDSYVTTARRRDGRKRTSANHDFLRYKDQAGVPWEVARKLRKSGWYVRQDVIWSKAGGNCPKCHYRLEKGSGLPESVTDRFVRAHEHVFLLTKRPDYFFDHERAKEKGTVANRRDVIHLPAGKFRGAHVAAMPVELAKVLVSAGTSEHGACKLCGAPWKRIVERGAPLLEQQLAAGGNEDGTYDGQALKDYEKADAQNASDVKRRVLESMRERITTGWSPTCDCKTDEVEPCVVLDPFSGAATTGVAALELGNRYIGIELDAKINEEVAQPRLRAVKRTAAAQVATTLAGSAVFQGRAEDVLADLPAGCARLILADPPYNVSRDNNFHTMGRTGIKFEWDGGFDQETWLGVADRVLMPGGSIVVWNDWKILGLVSGVLEDMGYAVKRMLVWHKTNAMPRNTNRSPIQAVEAGLWAVKPGAKWVFNKAKDKSYEDAVFRYAVPRGKKGEARHPAKKPDGLYHEIIEMFTNPGDLVVDPFCGSGTTAYVATKLGRHHVSIDLDPAWVTETKQRWQAAKDEVDACGSLHQLSGLDPQGSHGTT